MKRILFTASFAALIAGSAAAGEIPVNRVILSTSGLANFEHRAQVDGDEKVEFPVRFEQVDDILKSLVVFDAKGRLGGVTLPGKQPLAQVFKDLPFTQAQLSSPMLLLNAYQGAEVNVKGDGVSISGKILHVESVQVVHEDGMMETKHRLSLMTDTGLRQVTLEDMQSLQFAEDKIRAEIARALDAIRENGTAERRVLAVDLRGPGTREITLSYVVDAPLWKAAYRMVVPETGKEKGLLQGWAVIENMTASDWSDVDLTLVSGNPVTFRQSLYESYYVDRPEIPVQVFGRVMPRVDHGALASAEEMEGKQAYDKLGARRDDGRLRKTMAPAAAPMEKMMMGDAAVGGFAGAPAMPQASVAMEMDYGGMDTVAQAASAAQSAEATTQVLFRFPDRFDLKSGQSMMVPFLSRDIPMERISLYQPETHATHPLAAVEIQNDGDTGLPPGVLTLYEESALLKGTAFVGDAQVPVVGQGEKRLISYALDSKTTVNREDKSTSVEDKIVISQGIIRTAVKTRTEAVYTIKAPPKEDRTVVIEHPKMHDYTLVSPDPKSVEVTETHYRVKVPVKAGEKKVFPVVLENLMWQSWGIESMATDQLQAYATSRGNLDPETRGVFEELAKIRREMDAIDQQIYALDLERNRIFQDQERVRENLKSLDGKSDIQKKYLKKLEEQEDRIQQVDEEKEKLSRLRQKKLAEMKEVATEIDFK